MNTIKQLPKHSTFRLLSQQSSALWVHQQRAAISKRTIAVDKIKKPVEKEEPSVTWPRKIFSGIQPTGSLHLGNYLGAVQKWTQLQNAREDVTYCIVDMHSITLPQDPVTLRENIFKMAATLFACGIDPEKSTVFVQSAVKEHSELCWVLSCLTTMARLGHLPQYKEKTRTIKELPLGLFIYPVLQASDIMLYKSTHVPVGEDQVQHIQLTQHLAKTFNTKYSNTFPICHAIIENKDASRIRSLRDPTKKMSKSDPDPKATINLMDDPETIVDKFKKAVTDFQSDVSYQAERRVGVSNLIAIHSFVTGTSISAIVEEAKGIDTGKYKLRVADAVIEHLKPIRANIIEQLHRRNELIYMLEMGAEKARQVAQQTIAEVRQKVGLGAQYLHPFMEQKEEEPKAVPATEKKSYGRGSSSIVGKIEMPEVPKQLMRVEKKMKRQFESQAKLEPVLPAISLLTPAAADINAANASAVNAGDDAGKARSKPENDATTLKDGRDDSAKEIKI